MGKPRIPKKLKAELSATLFDYEIRDIERRTADEYLAGFESDGPDLDEDSAHIRNLARGVRELLAIGEVDAAHGYAVTLYKIAIDARRVASNIAKLPALKKTLIKNKSGNRP